MKKFHRIILWCLVIVFIIPLLNSCRKGEEDPWFSIYSRKHRLCLDWKIQQYRRDIMTDDSIVTYLFEGATQMYRKFTSNYTYSSPGEMRIIFDKDGNYEWNQSIITDTSSYLYSEKGLWYFTGGSKESDSRSKELLVFQKTERTESFTNGSINTTVSYFGSGDLNTTIYRIRKLASDELIIEGETITTLVDPDPNVSYVVKDNTEIIFEPM